MAQSEQSTTVAEDTKTEPQATANGTQGAQANDLDNLLAEIDQELSEAPRGSRPASGQSQEQGSDAEIVQLRRSVQEIEERAVRADIEDAVKSVQSHLKEGLPVTLSDRVVRGMLNDLALEDRRFLRAFQQRHHDPVKWQREILPAVAKQLRAELGNQQVDERLTQDRAAAEAAVRGASKGSAATDGAPDFRKMSDAEFEQWKRGQ